MTATNSQVRDVVPRPTFSEATKVWATIGLLSFGGPAGQIALMHRILVEERKWVSEARFLHALNFCMLLPGPEAQQLATYVGWLLHGTRGGIVAGTLFVLPGLAVILALSTVYALFRDTAWLESIFFGLKAAVLAIVIEAVIRIGRRALDGRFAVLLAAAAFLALFAFHVPFPLIILAAGIIGFLRVRLLSQDSPSGPRDDESEAAENLHAVEPTHRRAVRLVAVWGALWAAPVLAVAAVGGWDGIYARIALFFSWLAVVTFGGAYAVLAYVAEAAVGGFGWLDPGEMLDGLALAETTPGPLILVLSYVGYIAAFHTPIGIAPAVAGLLGGLLTAWVTFVPCFLWIFLGAPYVERLRSRTDLSGALAPITAAVVGVILNLALWFGLHVLFADVGALEWGLVSPAWPVWATVDPWAIALLAVAVVALVRLRLGIVATLAICAVLGGAIRLVL